MTPIERAREAAAKAGQSAGYQAHSDHMLDWGIPDNVLPAAINAALDAFLAKLAEDGMVLVPREMLVEKLGIALAQQGHSTSAEGMVIYEDDDGHECSDPYWRFHEFDKQAERMIAAMIAAAQGDGT